jgi:hypothetical protein
MVRRLVLAAGMLLLLGGCGDSGAPTASRTPAPVASASATPKPKGPIGSGAPVLVFCQRQGEGGATLDAITVRRDGTATLEKRHGGAGGRFKEQVLRKGELPRLKRALAALPAGESLTRGNPPPLSTQFILRYRGRTQTARQGGIVPRARPAVKLLDGLINGIGIRQTTRDRATHTY